MIVYSPFWGEKKTHLNKYNLSHNIVKEEFEHTVAELSKALISSSS